MLAFQRTMQVDERMQNELDMVRQILEEHLSAINDNSTEIQALFDYLRELEIKFEKISQRLDRIQLAYPEEQEKLAVAPLDQQEKQVFLALYTEETPLSCAEIARKARVPPATVADCISSLIEKQVPLLRSMVNSLMFFKLAPSFKERQAKENLVNLSLTSFM